MSLDKYKIRRFEQDELKPEETLADTLSVHPAIETPISRRVFEVFYIFIFLAVSFLILESFKLQILSGKNYAASVEQNNSSNYQLSSLRGIIYDSRGLPMVENVPVFDLVAVHRNLPNSFGELDKLINKLSVAISTNKDNLAKLFEDNKGLATFVIKEDISKEEIVKIQTLALPGIYPVANAKRYYAGSQAVAHLVGYTARVSQKDLANDHYYFINDKIGRLGIEAQYEKELRGQHRSVDLSAINGGGTSNDSVLGDNLFLNVDSSVQEMLFQSLSSVFNSAGVHRGAAIVQDPKTGAVLGLVSMPSFDANIFENSSGQENNNKISNLLSNADKLLLNRAISGRYSPGSTIKPLLALAGLKEGVVTPSTMIFANGSISVRSEVDPNVFYTFRDWKVHGWTDIKKAIADSVDVYFYSLGGGYGSIKGLGIDKIENYIKGAGADKVTGIDLPGEISGFVPSKEWKKETKGESWYVGDTYNISIGQGDLGVTPIWLNTYIGAIANGGNLMKPYIVKEIKNPAGETLASYSPQVLSRMPFDQNTMSIVREGMRQTVLSGTATMLQDVPVALAAKTGTAQISGRGLNSLFAVFGPYDDPKIVMTVLVENISQSQGLAIRVANNFLKWYFNKSDTKQ